MQKTRRNEHDFVVWRPGDEFPGRLYFKTVCLREGDLHIKFACPELNKDGDIYTDHHLLLKYTSESVDFMEFEKFPIEKHRMWVSDSSEWLAEALGMSGGIFDDTELRHFLFVFADATVEILCLNEPSIIELERERE